MGKNFSLCMGALFCLAVTPPGAAQGLEKDTIKTPEGDLVITFVAHGTLVLSYAGKIIHVDPWTELADYTKLPKADLILVTHDHFDHLDLKAIELIRTGQTSIVTDEATAKQVKGAIVLKNGETREVQGIRIEAVPAYNLVQMSAPGKPFHPKGVGNGYIVTLGGKRIYIGGDTENTPEVKALKNIDIAFLPMNLPYTMTPEMVADAVKAFRPKVLYPYHQGDTDLSKLVALLKSEKDIELRLRKMP